jgi:hypothetical protein
MTTTTTHDYPLAPESADVAFDTCAEAYHQAALDDQVAELRALAESGVRIKPPEGTGTPAEVSAWIDRAEAELLEGLDPIAEAVSLAAGKSELTGRHHYSKAEVLSWFVRAVEKGCAVPRVRAGDVEDIFRLNRVPNARLRQEYERRTEAGQEALAASLARAIGSESRGKPDSSFALRVLGVESAPTGKQYLPSLRLFCSHDQAVAMADELGLTYHDVGV